jgi:hypothetical protein
MAHGTSTCPVCLSEGTEYRYDETDPKVPPPHYAYCCGQCRLFRLKNEGIITEKWHLEGEALGPQGSPERNAASRWIREHQDLYAARIVLRWADCFWLTSGETPPRLR